MADNTLLQDNISMTLTVEDTIKSEDATLTISAEMVLQTADQGQADITNGLTGIVDGDWEVISINKYSDSSGLEKWNVQAKVRTAEKNLNDVASKCRAVSRPGLQFKVSNVDYTPTTNEYEEFYQLLRRQLYGKINGEIAILKELTSRAYRVSNLNFSVRTESSQTQHQYAVEVPQKMTRANAFAAQSGTGISAMGGATAGAPAVFTTCEGSLGGDDDSGSDNGSDNGFAVSQKVTMTANFHLASVAVIINDDGSTIEWFY